MRAVLAISITIGGALPGTAQQISSRTLGPPFASVITDLQSVGQLTPVGSGNIMVNDPVGRRVLLLDERLAVSRVVLDSAARGQASYGSGGALLARFRGDSAVFFNRGSASLVILAPNGDVGRVAAAFGAGRFNIRSLSFSPLHGIVWNRQTPALNRPLARGQRPKKGGLDVEIVIDDSTAVVTEQIGTRALDTLRKLATGQEIIRIVGAKTDRATVRWALFPFIDEMAVMTDGTLAIFRSRDCRIEWIKEYGRSTSSRLPCRWRRIDEAERQRLADSVRAVREESNERQLGRWLADSTTAAAAGKKFPVTVVTSTGVDGVTSRREAPIPRPAKPPAPQLREFPDFRPVTTQQAVYADADNRLWIRFIQPETQQSPSAVFDVFDRAGKAVDRIEIPRDRSIGGFSPGLIYLFGASAGQILLEAYRLK